MQQQTLFEGDRPQGKWWMKTAVTSLLVSALGFGFLSLVFNIWPPPFAWLDPVMLNVLQGGSIAFIAIVLAIRHWLVTHGEKAACSRKRQLQAMLSMFRVVKHELNNDMQVMVGNAELASMMLDTDSPASRPVGKVCEAATLAIDRIQQLTVFSSSGRTELTAVDLNAILRETVARLTNEVPAIVRFRLELEPLPARVMADRSLLTLSLSYLMRLAAKSLYNGGEIVVKTSHLHGAGHSGDINITSEIYIMRGLSGAGGGSGMTSGDTDRRVRFASILQQAQVTTTALVERSGAAVMKGGYTASDESLIKMGFKEAMSSSVRREVVLEDTAKEAGNEVSFIPLQEPHTIKPFT